MPDIRPRRKSIPLVSDLVRHLAGLEHYQLINHCDEDDSASTDHFTRFQIVLRILQAVKFTVMTQNHIRISLTERINHLVIGRIFAKDPSRYRRSWGLI
jgi:hypothetical protein